MTIKKKKMKSRYEKMSRDVPARNTSFDRIKFQPDKPIQSRYVAHSH